VIPFLVVVILRDPRVHISGPNGSDGPTKIKRVIYQQLCFETILRVPNIKPNDSYIRFGKSLDDPRFSYKSHIFK